MNIQLVFRIVFILVLSTTHMEAQEVVKNSDFTNSDWFGRSTFNDLLTKDTITIFTIKKLNGRKISGKKLLRKYLGPQKDIPNPFDTLVLMNFKNKGKLALHERILSQSDQRSKTGKWNYNEEDRILSFIMDNKVISYRFLSDIYLNTKLEDERHEPLEFLFKEIKFEQINPN